MGELLTMYVVERWLARLVTSPYRDDFILKGGMLLASLGARRPTADADALARNMNADQATVMARVVDIAAVPMPDDGVEFDLDGVRSQQIREESLYAGTRVKMPARLATAQVRLSLDINFGDPVTPGPSTIELPTLLPGGQPVRVLGYPVETVMSGVTGELVIERAPQYRGFRDRLGPDGNHLPVDFFAVSRALSCSPIRSWMVPRKAACGRTRCSSGSRSDDAEERSAGPPVGMKCGGVTELAVAVNAARAVRNGWRCHQHSRPGGIVRNMAAKKINLTVSSPIEVGNVDIKIEVRSGNAKMGDLTVSKGGVDWRASGKRSATSVTWEQLAALLVSKDAGSASRPPKAAAQAKPSRAGRAPNAADQTVPAKTSRTEAKAAGEPAPVKTSRAARRTKPVATTEPALPAAKEIRAWAKESGVAFNPRGNVSMAVLNQYRAAHH